MCRRVSSRIELVAENWKTNSCHRKRCGGPLRPNASQYLVEHIHQPGGLLMQPGKLRDIFTGPWWIILNGEPRLVAAVWALGAGSRDTEAVRTSVDLYAAICHENALSWDTVHQYAPQVLSGYSRNKLIYSSVSARSRFALLDCSGKFWGWVCFDIPCSLQLTPSQIITPNPQPEFSAVPGTSTPAPWIVYANPVYGLEMDVPEDWVRMSIPPVDGNTGSVRFDSRRTGSLHLFFMWQEDNLTIHLERGAGRFEPEELSKINGINLPRRSAVRKVSQWLFTTMEELPSLWEI